MSNPNHSTEYAPKVSVVMAVFNRVDVVNRALDSVLAQSYPNIELVVVDGGSTDGTKELLESRRAELDYFHSGPDDGIYDAWNHGIRASTGDWVLFLGSDDAYADADAVSRLVHAAVADPRCNLVVGRAIQWFPDGALGAVIGTSWSRRRMHLCMVVAHPACMTARSVLDQFGPFSTDVGVAADYDLYLRASAEIIASDVPEVITKFSIGGVTTSQVGRVLKSTRTIQAMYAGIGPRRAALQYAGFKVALPVRTALRRIRGALTTRAEVEG